MTEPIVLVTGATGFVGSRLLERLALGGRYRARAMVRSFSGAGMARLARLPVEIAQADLRDAEALKQAAAGCSTIVHCAYGASGDPQTRRDITVGGTENLLLAAQQAGISRVVYLSTGAVYGNPPSSAVVTEETPFAETSDLYISTKQSAEHVLRRYQQERHLPIVIIRPTLIYGPYSAAWTVQIIKELQNGVVLPDGGAGAANFVYIDNLVDAIVLSIEHDAACGQDFIVTDGEQLTWGDIYTRYATMLAQPRLIRMSQSEIEQLRRKLAIDALRRSIVTPLVVAPVVLPELARASFQSKKIRAALRDIPWMRALLKRLPADMKQGARQAVAPAPAASAPIIRTPELRLPSAERTQLLTAPSRFSSAKIRQMLGYQQRIAVEEGFALTRDWLLYQGLLSDDIVQ